MQSDRVIDQIADAIDQPTLDAAIARLERSMSAQDAREVECMQDRLEDALADIYESAARKAIRHAIDDRTSTNTATLHAMHNVALASLRLARQTLSSYEETAEAH